MTTSSITFPLETSWATGVVEPILETRNANDVGMHVWFIHSLIKKIKKMYKIYNKKTKIRPIKSDIRLAM